MFGETTLAATPGTARRLLAIAQINQMKFDDQLIELASRDLVSSDQLKGFDGKLSNGAIQALQHVMDWNGRAMLLDTGNDVSRTVALASIWLRGGRTLLMVKPEHYGEWATLIRKSWPDAKISVFGNPRYIKTSTPYPEGISCVETPDLTADFIITSYGSVIWHNVMAESGIDQTIVEELDFNGAVHYNWEEAVKGMFFELPSPLLIQNIYGLPAEQGMDQMNSLEVANSASLAFLGKNIHHYLWSGLPISKPLNNFSFREAMDYMANRYQNISPLKLLNLYGVSSHLLGEKDGSQDPLIFHSSVIARHAHGRGSNGNGYVRYIELERDLVHRMNVSRTDLVRRALDGDTVVQGLIGALRTNQWSNLKAGHIKQIHGSLANKSTRCLFLAENPDLRRNLKLQFSTQIDSFAQESDRDLVTGRFLHPQFYHKLTLEQFYQIKPLANLMVSINDLINVPELMPKAGLLFLPELPLDREVFNIIREAAVASGTRLVISVLDETLEEKIYQQLL